MCLGIPGQIIEIHRDTALASGIVDFGGARREVCLAYVDGHVTVGDYVIVHVGFAISKVDEDEAHKTYAILQAMNELGDLELIRRHAESLVDLPSLPSAGPPPAGSLA